MNTDMKNNFSFRSVYIRVNPWLIFLLDRAFLLLPQIVPTQQRCRVFDSFCLESDHRTGGRMFGLSRTVGDNHLVTRKLVDMVENLARRDELCAGNVSDVI